jgi:hypothetical protein
MRNWMRGKSGRYVSRQVAKCDVVQRHHSRRLHVCDGTFLFAVLSSGCKNKLLSKKDESQDAHYFSWDWHLREFRPNPCFNSSRCSPANSLHGGPLPLWVEHGQTQQEGGNGSCNQFVV